MTTPHTCPVCHGKGTVPAGFYDTQIGFYETPMDAKPEEKCRTCKGKGMVWPPCGEWLRPPVRIHWLPRDPWKPYRDVYYPWGNDELTYMAAPASGSEPLQYHSPTSTSSRGRIE